MLQALFLYQEKKGPIFLEAPNLGRAHKELISCGASRVHQGRVLLLLAFGIAMMERQFFGGMSKHILLMWSGPGSGLK